MSSVQSVAPSVTRRSYVALSAFNNEFYNYSCNFDSRLLKEVGILTVNPNATVLNCPKGRILYENGKKLNPADGNFRGANDGIVRYMVGVYDPISGLNGFIDPNSPFFGLQNTDKPIYLTPPSNGPDDYLGNGVLTNGPIETTLSLTAGTSLSTGTSVSAGTSVVAGTYVASRQINVPLYNAGGGAVPYNPLNSVADVFINSTAGNVFVITAPSGSALANIYVYFNPSPLIPGDVPPVNGSLMTLIFVNGANRAVTVNITGAVVKRTANTLVLSIGVPNPTVSTIMFAGANNFAIELNRSGPMGF